MIGPKSVRLTIASVVALAVAAARAVVVPVAAVAALGPLAALVAGAAGPLAPVAVPRVIFVARRLVAPGQSSGKQCHYQVNQYFFREVRFVLLKIKLQNFKLILSLLHDSYIYFVEQTW